MPINPAEAEGEKMIQHENWEGESSEFSRTVQRLCMGGEVKQRPVLERERSNWARMTEGWLQIVLQRE